VVDSSSPIQTQLSAVDNNNDIGWYPNSAKAVKDAKKYLFANSNSLQLHLDTVSKMRTERVFSWGIFFVCKKGKRFVKVHLCCIVRNLKKDKRNVDVVPLEKFLWTPMIPGCTTFTAERPNAIKQIKPRATPSFHTGCLVLVTGIKIHFVVLHLAHRPQVAHPCRILQLM